MERRVKKGLDIGRKRGDWERRSGAPGGSDSEEPPTQSRILEGESRDKKTTKTGVWVPPRRFSLNWKNGSRRCYCFLTEKGWLMTGNFLVLTVAKTRGGVDRGKPCSWS